MSKIIKLNAEELRKLQLIELEMLVEVDRICRKNDIKYSIDAGTLLGAVRHKGFIPWDDDLDFEGIRAMAIQGYDEYLTARYGNYMELPPEDQRKGVMDAVEFRFIDVTHEQILERYRQGLQIVDQEKVT